MTENGLRIGLFGGAFDPVHIGHQRAVDSFLNSNLIHELHLLPTASPPHKDGESAAGFHHRSKMLQLAFTGNERVVINALENQLSRPSYTLQTIVHLQETYPDNIYFLCIGEDNLNTFHEWHGYKKLLERVTLLVAGRPGSDRKKQSGDILKHTIFIDHEELEVSSTDIRATNDYKKLVESVPESVIEYIKKHHLYTEK